MAISKIEISTKEGLGEIATPAVFAGVQIQFEQITRACGFVDLLHLSITGHGRIHLETGVVGADVDQQGARSDEPLYVGQVDELEQSGRDLHAAVVVVADAEGTPQIAVTHDLGSAESLVAQ